MGLGIPCLIALGIVTATSSSALADSLPRQVGQCAETRIKELGSRLEGMPDSGSAVTYANGGYGVSYEMVAPLQRAHVGDRIKLCLVSVPENCPPGDDRGRQYKATDLRTHGSWTLPDAEHMCGGA